MRHFKFFAAAVAVALSVVNAASAFAAASEISSPMAKPIKFEKPLTAAFAKKEASFKPGKKPLPVVKQTVITGTSYEAKAGENIVAEKGSYVWASKGSHVDAMAGSIVIADYGSTVTAFDGSTVNAYDGSKVLAKKGSKVVTESKDLVTAEPGATVIVEIE